MLKKLLICLLVLLLSVNPAAAEEVSVEMVSTQIGENHVTYPQLSGMADVQIQQKINDDIVLTSGVANHLVTLATLGGTPWTLQVDTRVCLLHEQIFSAIISAKGKLPGQRDGHAYTALSYDLSTGEKLTLDQLMTDVDKAVAWMEEEAEKTLGEEWNGYMEYTDVRPLPTDSFTLDETGITFWYPFEQFSLLSGYSGACQFWYEELNGLWRWEEVKRSNEEIRSAVEKSAQEGVLPNVPVSIGQSMQEVTQAYRLLRTPDEFPGGRYFVMEDPAFRQILVISDSIEDDFARSVVEGIQLRRGGLHGLLIGHTSQKQWREILGSPISSIDFTQNMAYDYNLPAGQYDVYQYGTNELRLHADESGVLCAIQLCR